jgi:hypothetical protein
MIEANPLHQRWEGVPELLKLLFASLLIVPIAIGQITLTTAQIAKRVSPAVVVIQGKTDSGEVQGSGFVVSKDGKIVTNLHVIKDMKTASVQLANGEVFDSVFVLATDERRDLAVVQISGFNLPILELGNSDALTVGEPLVIVGTPRGLEGTVTAGILSSVRDGGDGFKVLQTDAAVNPGNSGGPLVNNKGQAIGVVSFKLRSAEGLNFAVPINYVRGLLSNLHEPMTLEQMRTSTSATTSTEQGDSGPSLRETLDWLKEKVPLSGAHYVMSLSGFLEHMGPTKDVSYRTVPKQFESCTVVLDYTETTIWEKFKDIPVVDTTRYTVPLAEVTKVWQFKHDVVLNNSWPRPEKITTFESWVVVLDTTSNVILSEGHESLHNTTKTENIKSAHIAFHDESVANRVVEAFRHATDLCRGKQPF